MTMPRIVPSLTVAAIRGITVACFALLSLPAVAADSNRRCGEYCLRIALPALGFPNTAVVTAIDRLGAAPSAGHAMADLAAAAEAAGGAVLAVETTLENLAARRAAGERFACVAHFDGDHWALLSGFGEDGRVEVVDPPRSYRLAPETLAARWDRKALLVSRSVLIPEADLPQPFPWPSVWLASGGAVCLLAVGVWWQRRHQQIIAATLFLGVAVPIVGCHRGDGGVEMAALAADRPPRAVFEFEQLDGGIIPLAGLSDGTHTFTFPLANRGGSPLHVSGVIAGCGRTDVQLTARVLAPGETAEVRAVIAPRHPERRDVNMVVQTDDPDRPETTLNLRWEAVAPLSPDPPELDFGPVLAGEIMTRTIRLRRHPVAGGAAGEPEKLTAFAPSVGGTLAAAFQEAEPKSGDRRVAVTLTAPRTSGVGGGAVEVTLAGGPAGSAESLRVPVRFEVREILSVRPSRAFLGSGPAGAAAAARLIVTGRGGLRLTTEPTLADDDGQSQTQITVRTRRLATDRLLVELSGTLPTRPGRHESTLRITASVEELGGTEPRTLAVPVSAFVTGPAVIESETVAGGG